MSGSAALRAVLLAALMRSWPGIALAAPLSAPVTVLADGEFSARLEEAVKGAAKEVVICAYLFRTSGRESNLADRLVKCLTAAAARGVEVRVLLEQDREDEGLSGDNRRTGRELAAGGVRVTYDYPAVRTHAKLAVIDRRFSFIGSHNLTDSALAHNRELSVMIDSPEVAARLLEYIRSIPAR